MSTESFNNDRRTELEEFRAGHSTYTYVVTVGPDANTSKSYEFVNITDDQLTYLLDILSPRCLERMRMIGTDAVCQQFRGHDGPHRYQDRECFNGRWQKVSVVWADEVEHEDERGLNWGEANGMK